MKIALPLLLAVLTCLACSHKNYVSYFDQQTANHRAVAVLPAEMIFTGKPPANLTGDNVREMEDVESKNFQYALYNSILRYANSSNYYMRVNLQDIVMTQKILEDNHLTFRELAMKDDRELTTLLKVDAVVRLHIQEKRLMSDGASYGISVGRDIIQNTRISSKIPVPYIPNKTSDIYASCDVVSNNLTLWNDNYKSSAAWDRPSNIVIENITDNFGRHFPYKLRR
ncbi:MAG TPA: hypothetical protein VGC95_12910 [Chitinophagaceae bacterium]|jgi:hypothetical protein